MFKRLFGKKQEDTPADAKSKQDQKLEQMVKMAAKVDDQIALFDKQNEVAQKKRELLMQKALQAKKAGKVQLTKRCLLQVKQLDQKIKRFDAMSLKLTNVKDMCESYLAHSEFMLAAKSATDLIDAFGIDQREADKVMDKMEDIKGRIEDFDASIVPDETELDVDDLDAELDMMLAEETANELPSAGNKVHKSVGETVNEGASALPSVPQKVAVAEEDNLEDMLNDL